MKQWIKMALSLSLLAASVAQAAELKIGVVDVERLLRESEPAMQAEKKIESSFTVRDQEIKRLIKQAKDAQLSLERDGSRLSEAQRRDREAELTKQNVNLQRLQREFREDLNLRKNEELVVVMDQANKAIQQIAAQEKFDLILQEAVYRNPQLDITDKVIRHLSRGGQR